MGRPTLKFTVDTNVLIRAAAGDDLSQMRAAAKFLQAADVVAVSVSSLCEMVWVLHARYRLDSEEIAGSLEKLLTARNVVTDRAAVAAGLAMLREGGDFADGVIAHDGALMGGETFVSFDKKAVRALKKMGKTAEVLR